MMTHVFPLLCLSDYKYSSHLKRITGWVLPQGSAVIKEIYHHEAKCCCKCCNYNSFRHLHPSGTDISGGNGKENSLNFIYMNSAEPVRILNMGIVSD